MSRAIPLCRLLVKPLEPKPRRPAKKSQRAQFPSTKPLASPEKRPRNVRHHPLPLLQLALPLHLQPPLQPAPVDQHRFTNPVWTQGESRQQHTTYGTFLPRAASRRSCKNTAIAKLNEALRVSQLLLLHHYCPSSKPGKHLMCNTTSKTCSRMQTTTIVEQCQSRMSTTLMSKPHCPNPAPIFSASGPCPTQRTPLSLQWQWTTYRFKHLPYQVNESSRRVPRRILTNATGSTPSSWRPSKCSSSVCDDETDTLFADRT